MRGVGGGGNKRLAYSEKERSNATLLMFIHDFNLLVGPDVLQTGPLATAARTTNHRSLNGQAS